MNLSRDSDLNQFRRILDVLHTIMIFMSDWSWLIAHFGDAGISNWIPW